MIGKIEQIIWDGCDGYIFPEEWIDSQDYSISKNKNGSFTLHSLNQSFESFLVVEINQKSIEIDEDGEMVLDGVFLVGDRFFKNI